MMFKQIEIFDVPSPCKRICETDKQGYCLGCFRSREERFNWLKLANEQKRDILRLCSQRALRKRYSLYKQAMQQANQQLMIETDEQLDLF